MIVGRCALCTLTSLIFTLVAGRVGAGTVAWWRFEEGAPGTTASGVDSILDSSGHGLNGTPVGLPVYSADVSPWSSAIGSSRSLHLNGNGQYVAVPDAPVFQLTHSLTIEAIFKTEPMLAPGAAGNILFRGDNRPGLDPYRLSVLQPGNGLIFQIDDAANNFTRLSYTLPFDQWVSVAGTLDDATGLMSLYVNGSLVASTTTSIRPLGALDPASSPGIGLGGGQTALSGEIMNGWLDEIRLSDVALRPDQFLVVPEPSLFALVGLGGLLAVRCRRLR